ncbi:MAG: HAD hydrolase family protein [Epsilonproteobacteria bacterium]|nr:HAD hydrolase family protein [Campylobacterota bacterium]
MIKLIVLDVDGCMTNGAISYLSNGDEMKSFNVKDGLAIASWIRMGRKAAIITGRVSSIVTRRAKELGICHLYQNVKDKKAKLDEIVKKENISLEEVAVIGDDLNDYKMLKEAGLSFAPADASFYIKNIVNVVLNKKGGEGAVREMIEYIIKKENLEEEFLRLWV